MVMMNINDITFDPLLYPRVLHEGRDGALEPFWLPAARMARAQRAGEEFPPIILAKLHDKNILIDGYNRLLAHKQNDRTEISAEFIEVANETEAFIQAVRRNNRHGNNLGELELAKAAVKLREEFGRSEIEISQILSITPLELK